MMAREIEPKVQAKLLAFVKDVERLGEAYVKACTASAEMTRRQSQSMLLGCALYEAADRDDHPLLTPSQARKAADKEHRRQWIQRDAARRLAALARRRLMELHTVSQQHMEDINGKLALIDGVHMTKNQPARMNRNRFDPEDVTLTDRATTLLQEFGRKIQDLGNGIVEVHTDLGFTVEAAEIGRSLLVLTGSLSEEETRKLLAHAATVGWRARNGHRIPIHVHASGEAIHLTAE